MGKAKAIIEVMRPINCVMMGFAVFVGAVLANPAFAVGDWLKIAYGFLTGFTLCAAAMVVNDYYDRAIDAVNEPSRPIPSGLVSIREALVLAFVLTVVGFGFAFFTSVLCLGVAAVSWVIVVAYVTVGKRTGLPGNFLVSACVATPFIYGGVEELVWVRVNVRLF